MSGPAFRSTPLLDADAVEAGIAGVAEGIRRRHPDGPLAVVGIHTRGVALADRLAQRLADRSPPPDRGALDISLYRDDLDNLGTIPTIRSSDIPFPVDGATIVLCDDVLFTGRTIRAAVDQLIDYGRPACIELAVLVDRGNRELPIAATYTGHTLDTARTDHIAVRFRETDGEDAVVLLRPEEAGS